MTMDRDSSDGFAQLSEIWSDDQTDDDRATKHVDPRSRRTWRILLLVVAIIITAVLAAGGGYVAWALNAPLGAPVIAIQQPEAIEPNAASIALPTEGAWAISVAGADEYLGADASGVWATGGTNEPRPIASISKLITALVVLDANPLAGVDDPGPTITFDKADHDLYDDYYVLGATIAEMPTGSSMSLHDALSTMLVPSASNYADAVSTWAFGSQSGFRAAAQNWLDAHGLTGTTILEPTGIDARNASTPTDLLALGKIAAANPVIAQITAMRSISLPGPGSMSNTNNLLGTNGITGLKTGNLGEGNYALLYTASLDVGTATPLQVTSIVLGGFSRQSVNASVIATLDSIRSGFREVPVIRAGSELGTLTTPWGDTAKVVVPKGASIFTWSDTPITATMDTTTPVTYTDGEQVGTITWTTGINTTTAVLQIEGNIEPPTEWWRLTNPDKLGG